MYGPGVNSTSNRDEYQEYFLGVKGRQPYQLHVPNVSKRGSLNLLKLWACTGFAFYCSYLASEISSMYTCMFVNSFTHLVVQCTG
jgi:hypothetical protein